MIDRPLVAEHKDAGDFVGPDQDLAGRRHIAVSVFWFIGHVLLLVVM
jgi:hypothetical protein